jgi:hypothetical protein
MDDDECGAVGGMLGRGYRSTRRKHVVLSATNPTSPDQVSNPSRLSYCTASETHEPLLVPEEV